MHKGAKNKEQRTWIKYTSVNGVILLFGLQIFTTVCSSSDLVGSVSFLGVWRCGLLLMLLLSGREVQRSPLYRLLPRTGPPWMSPGWTGMAWYLALFRVVRKEVARVDPRRTRAQLPDLVQTPEKPKMISTSSSSSIYGPWPRIRGRSVISTEPGLYWHLCKGWSM